MTLNILKAMILVFVLLLPRVSSGYEITITAYSPKDSGGKCTASGKKPATGHLAVSRDLLRVFPFGSRVRLLGKVYEVTDVMPKQWSMRADVWMEDHEEAKKFGKRKDKILCANKEQ